METRLKEIREKKGINQKDLAKETGISRQRYNHYENGRRELPVEIAKKIGEKLKINWWEIYK